MFIPIAEFRPDIADINGSFSDEICNVLPADGSYIPMPSFSPLTMPLPDAPLGGVSVRGRDGNVATFAGTRSKLYQLDNTNLSWVDVSQSGTSYSANEEARWSFAAFGSFIIAVNKNDAPQVLQLGVDQHFRDLGGAPPRAGLVKIWGDFVCLMQLPDNPGRVHWSGLNDAEWWSVGSRNCDFQDFADGGLVQGSTETTNPLIFLQSAIYQAAFVPGSDIVFSFQKLHEKRGVSVPLSIATRGATAFYADEGGFFQISSNGSLMAIGFENVDRTIFSRLKAVEGSMMAAIDPIHPRVYWAVDMQGRGFFTDMLVYDWGLERWSRIMVNITAVMSVHNAGTTLEGLDLIASGLEDVPFSLDSRAFAAGAPILAAFSSDDRLGLFSGPAMAAQVSSVEMGATDGSMQWLRSVYPVVDSIRGEIVVGHRLRRHQGEAIKWANPRRASAHSGRIHTRARSRFHTLRLQLPVGDEWHHIKGFDVDIVHAGWR